MGAGKWGAYASSICHYCGGRSETDDHIVPRSILPKPQSRLPYWYRSRNVVPSCKACNNWKANFRSDCYCSICVWAWGEGRRFIQKPMGWKPKIRKVLKAA